MPQISLKEWKLVWWTILGLISLSLLMSVFGIIQAPPGNKFWGIQQVNKIDAPVYYSWIEQGRTGHFLFQNLFTPEIERPFIFDIFWLSLGLLAKIFSWSTVFVYQVAKIVWIPILLIIIYLFCAYFFQETSKRKWSFWLIVFGSGAGGYFYLLAENLSFLKRELIPMDLWVSEGFTFFTLTHSPHFMASLALILLIFLFTLIAIEKRRWIYSFSAGFGSLILFQFHPYHLPTIFGIIGLYLIILIIKYKYPLRLGLKYFLTIIMVSGPSLFYHFLTLRHSFIKQQIVNQNICLSPVWWISLLSYGFLIIFAVIGTWSFLKSQEINQRRLFLIVWSITQFFLLYLPVTFQRRLITGLQIPISLLAIYGIYFLGSNFKKHLPQKTIIIIILASIFCFSNYIILVQHINLYTIYWKESPHIYLDKSHRQSMQWLAKNTSQNDIILSSYYHGNLIPALALGRVYWGHWDFTADFEKKHQQVKWFFENDINDKQKIKFLKQNHISYLFYGDEEKLIGLFNPEKKEYLKKVFQNNEISIYKIID